MSINIGLLGELRVEQRLVEEGWHPVRLDTAQMAINADLIAVKQKQRIAIQVKTTKAVGHSHKGFLGFGYAKGYLKDGSPVFNSKGSPLLADVIVGVSYSRERTRFVLLPVAVAEKLCRQWAEYCTILLSSTVNIEQSISPCICAYQPAGALTPNIMSE